MPLSLSTWVTSKVLLIFATSLVESWPLVRVRVLEPTDSVSFCPFAISVLIEFKMVDTPTAFVSEDGRKNRKKINTIANAMMSQIKPVLNHFPLLDMGDPLLYH